MSCVSMINPSSSLSWNSVAVANGPSLAKLYKPLLPLPATELCWEVVSSVLTWSSVNKTLHLYMVGTEPFYIRALGGGAGGAVSMYTG